MEVVETKALSAVCNWRKTAHVESHSQPVKYRLFGLVVWSDYQFKAYLTKWE